ncbi:MAG: hypothetical protein ACR2HJ_09005 [Fimbriimonadales bacterium]
MVTSGGGTEGRLVVVKDEAARDLVTALEIVAAISAEESQELAQSRGESERLEGEFEAFLNERMAGRRGASRAPMDWLSENMSGLTNKHSRRVQRESAFVQSFHALVRLYAAEEARATADRVFSLLREIRLIDIGDDPALFASDLQLPANASQWDNLKERTRASLGSVSEYQGRMREAVRNLNARCDKKIELLDALLAEALATAKTLL